MSWLKSVNCRHSHRDLLKTANTMVNMRDILENVQLQSKQLMRYSSEAIATPGENSQRYHKHPLSERVILASAIAFIRACLDISHTSSYLLSAKAIPASLLAVNTLPRVFFPYTQFIRDEFATSRTALLKQIDQACLHAHPLEALQSYAFITGSSLPEVLDHLLTSRLASIRAALSVSSPDTRTILHVVRSIKSTITDVQALFPLIFQRTMHELKSTSLLSYPDLKTSLQRRGGNIELWIQPDIKKFLVWTKSEPLDETRVDTMIHSWMDKVNSILNETAGGLFVGIQELDVLCGLRGEIISALDDDTSFEARLRGLLTLKIAEQITRLMTSRVQRIHHLETAARDIINRSKGLFVNYNS